MAYDEALAGRIRSVLGTRADVAERKMFGGLAFMVGGHMACGVLGRELIVRVGSNAQGDLVAQPHVRPFDFTGRPTRGMVYVAAEGIASDAAPEHWVAKGLAHAATRPAKQSSRP